MKNDSELIQEYLDNGGEIKIIGSDNPTHSNDYKFDDNGKLFPQKRLQQTNVYFNNSNLMEDRGNIDNSLRNYGK